MNSYISQNVVIGQEFMNSLLACISTRPAAALVAAGKIRLSLDPSFNPTPQSTAATLSPNEATFTGYAAGGIAMVLSGAVNVSPVIQGVLANALFTATGSAISNNVYGYWIDDGTNLVIGERFSAAQIASFATAGDFLDLTCIIPGALQQAA
jgi:hypothetical protein